MYGLSSLIINSYNKLKHSHKYTKSQNDEGIFYNKKCFRSSGSFLRIYSWQSARGASQSFINEKQQDQHVGLSENKILLFYASQNIVSRMWKYFLDWFNQMDTVS